MSSKTETQKINVQIQRGLIDRKKRQLIITQDFIQFEDKWGTYPYTTFQKEDICEFRYGINWIRGYQFTIGREHVIFIRNSSGKELKISFKTFYGSRKREYHILSNNILDALWDFFFSPITNERYDKFKKGADITIGRATLTKEAIIVDEGGLMKGEKKIIPWDKMEIKAYQTYMVIFSSADPLKTNAAFNYLKDWNTIVLHSVVKFISDKKKNK